MAMAMTSVKPDRFEAAADGPHQAVLANFHKIVDLHKISDRHDTLRHPLGTSLDS